MSRTTPTMPVGATVEWSSALSPCKGLCRRLVRGVVMMLIGVSSLFAKSDDWNEERLPDDSVHQRSAWFRLVEAGHRNVFDLMREMTADTSIRSGHRTRQWKIAQQWIAKLRPLADANGNVEVLEPSLYEIFAERSRRRQRDESPQANDPRWEGIGPFGWDTSAVLATGSQGIGVVRSHVVWPADRRLVLAGTISAGIWRSTDAGRTWSAVAPDEPIQ
ncbi:MAG: hypothetical protein ACKOE4_07655 [Candidatus Kapaibacterium sp.]